MPFLTQKQTQKRDQNRKNDSASVNFGSFFCNNFSCACLVFVILYVMGIAGLSVDIANNIILYRTQVLSVLLFIKDT